MSHIEFGIAVPMPSLRSMMAQTANTSKGVTASEVDGKIEGVF